MLNVVILSVANKPIVLSVVMLNVVAPWEPFYPSLLFAGKFSSLPPSNKLLHLGGLWRIDQARVKKILSWPMTDYL